MSRVALDTLINRSVRNMGDIDSRIKDMTIEMIKRAYQEGINVQISSGLRTNDEQNRLYAKGRTTSGNIVTNARAGQSAHNYGLAVDYFLTDQTGTRAVWTVNAQWKRVAAIAKSMGFTWGGDWTSFPDASHLEYTKGLTWRDLQAGRRPSFTQVQGVEKTWLEFGDEGAGVKAMQELLNSHGYDLVTDGIFGPKTERAVRSFQSENGLIVDGVYGVKTKAALEG
ncbi:peptidoglycan-binding protein [Jeotgalibacillus haloalkalitolerans]|uniref:Peptidoglycan-binding protein n=1 Tax=Jeotgalibacillus haloalkalitolerans TaxID=3104292 RepID=A0ABU5KQU6_9BACL|nr:peptidoglycan-binding protein [Jeotgalibacillus sp. HH7-29]MDZ5713617.1 peptidoglycan-binding protein [Jeotgalibacillus sp. HH7-29]